MCLWIPNFQMSRFPDFQILDAGRGDDGQTLRCQLDRSPNAPRDQIRRKEPLLRPYCPPRVDGSKGCLLGNLAFLRRPSCLSDVIPQTGLALMGFSRYCPNSLDLLHFVVPERRGSIPEPRRSHRGGIWKSENLESKQRKQKHPRMNTCSAQNVGKVLISK